MSKKFVNALAIASVLGLLLSGCGNGAEASDNEATDQTANGVIQDAADLVPEDIRDRGYFTAVVTGNPPNAVVNADRTEFSGLWPDVGYELAERLDLDIKFEIAKFDSLITGIEAKRFDVALTDMNDSLEHQKRVDFIDFYTSGDTVVVMEGSELSDITALGDLCGYTVSSQIGTEPIPFVEAASEEDCVAQGKPAIDIQTFPDNAANVLALRSERVDAMINSLNSAKYLQEQNPGMYHQTDVKFNDSINGVMFSKQTPELRDAVQVALQSMFDDGTYLEILENNGHENRSIEAPEINGVKE